MILLYLYFTFLLFIAFIIHSDETLFITPYHPIPEWKPINNESKSQNFFITNENLEENLTSSIQECFKKSYTSNVIQEDDHTYRVAIYKNYFETVFSINLYHITYDSLLHLLNNDRLNKINSNDTNPEDIFLLEFKFDYGDQLTYYECFKYLKNNYCISIEKSDELSYIQDLSKFKPNRGTIFHYDHTNPHHLPFVISMLYKNKDIGMEKIKILHDRNINDMNDPTLSYQVLSLILNFFSCNRIKYQNIPIQQNINNILFYGKLKMTLYNIQPNEDVSKKYITAYKSCCHTYINRFIIENLKSIFKIRELQKKLNDIDQKIHDIFITSQYKLL